MASDLLFQADPFRKRDGTCIHGQPDGDKKYRDKIHNNFSFADVVCSVLRKNSKLLCTDPASGRRTEMKKDLSAQKICG